MKLFVWDFHGVLEKDNDKGVLEITNAVLEQAGHNVRLSEEQNADFYGLKWYEYFGRLLPDLNEEDHKALQTACFVYADENLHILTKHIKSTEHSHDVIRRISDASHDQIILSNTRPSDLSWFVETVGLQDLFHPEKVIGVNAHEKHNSKYDAFEHYMNNREFDDIVIIGDSQKDMDLKGLKGGTTYFYTHPHLPQQTADADYHISNLRDILREI